jgi:hypothetical protein
VPSYAISQIDPILAETKTRSILFEFLKLKMEQKSKVLVTANQLTGGNGS